MNVFMDLQRRERSNDGIIGVLHLWTYCVDFTFTSDNFPHLVQREVRHLFSCDTLERPNTGLEKNKGLSLPCGNYNIKLFNSSKFNCVLPLIYKEGRVAEDRCILMHLGNTIKDSAGCILLGKRASQTFSLRSSRDTVRSLMSILIEIEKAHSIKPWILNIRNVF